GFFQLRGLSPGDYLVHAEHKRGLMGSQTVKILAAAAAELREPLILDEPKRLNVTVVPQLDPVGRLWRVRLASNNPRLRRSEVLSESQISAAGEWAHTRVLPGEYTITLLTGSGDVWKSQDLSVSHEDVTIAIVGLGAKISGEVTLGDRPLAATLNFGGEW